MKIRQLLLFLAISVMALASCTPEEQPPVVSYVFTDVSVEAGQTSATITCRNESIDDDKVHASVLLSKNENITDVTKYSLHLQNDTLRSTISGLESNTMYFFCFEVYTANEHKRTNEVHHFQTTGGSSGAVTVTTSEAINVTQTTATGGGSVTADGDFSVSMRGVCWDTVSNPNALQSPHMASGQGTGAFVVNITGLSPGTTYHMRAYAVCNDVPYYGNEVEFKTAQDLSSPTVVTGSVEGTTAHGEVTADGGAEVTERGVCWSTEQAPTTEGTHATSGAGTGSFSVELTDLTPGTTYYVRAYAMNSVGTAYGNEVTFTTMANKPTVTTEEVTNITQTTAQGGGNVTDDGGAEVTERGICWSTSHNPTVSGSHTTNGTGTGSFTSSITGLTANTTYYVRAYATNSAGTAYGAEVTFTTSSYAYVDLGLPSGLLWATCNVGADRPGEYGDYFAWGETQPKSTYYWSKYQHSNGGTSWYNPNLIKYCNDSDYGYNGFTDNLTTLEPSDDVATVQWGSGWRLPTKKEWQELLNNTFVTWTTQNGVIGRLFTASNGNSLFLPAAGCRNESSLSGAGSYGYYWSSSLYTDDPRNAWLLDFGSDHYYMSHSRYRCCGLSVRPVRSASQN